jgi:PAS domain S-box-containing protein
MSQAAKSGLWKDDLVQETGQQTPSWRIEKQADPVEDYLPFFPDQASGRVYEQLLFNIPVSVHCMDGSGRIISVNRQWLETLGYQLKDVTGRHWHEFISSASRNLLTHTVYPRYLQTNIIRNAEITMFKGDGQQAHMLMSAHGYRGNKGRIERSIVILQEVTARKSAETALKRSEQRFRGAFEAAAHGIVLVAPNGRIIAWNPAFKELSRRSDDQLQSLAFDESVHVEDKSAFLSGMRKLIDGAIPSLKMELRYVGGEKPLVWGFTSVSLVRNELGDIDHLVVQIVDTTSRRQAERQLQQAQKMEAVGQLTGGLAHDFNNILTVIMGNLALVENALAGDEKARQRLVEATEAASKGSELTRQLLSFSSQQAIEPKEVKVNDLISRMHSLLARTLGEAVELKLVLSPRSATLLVDPTQLETSLMNLAINARDAMADGGKLVIETQILDLDQDYVSRNPDVNAGQHVMIAVTDNGAGIPKELLDKVFQPFFSTKPEGKGSGLGLSMVYGFATRSNGHIRIYSEEGHGTSVKIYLPVKSIEETEAPPPEASPEAAEIAEVERFEPAQPEPAVREEEPLAAQPATEPAEESGAEKLQPEAPKAEEPRAEEPTAEDAKAEEPRAEEPTAEDAKAEEPKAEEISVEEVKPAPKPQRLTGWKTIVPLAPPSPKPIIRDAVPAMNGAADRPVKAEENRKTKILVVEDQEDVRAVASGFLADFGYEVVEAPDGIVALRLLAEESDIDLMFTDVVMPGGLNGFDLAQAAQQIRPDLLIVHTSGYPKGALVHMEEPRLKDNIIMKPYRREELQRVILETLSKRD